MRHDRNRRSTAARCLNSNNVHKQCKKNFDNDDHDHDDGSLSLSGKPMPLLNLTLPKLHNKVSCNLLQPCIALQIAGAASYVHIIAYLHRLRHRHFTTAPQYMG